MRRHRHADFQKLTSDTINRISSLQQQGLLDVLLERVVWPSGGGAPLAAGATAYFPIGAKVEYDSVDRSTGAVMKITAGLGIKHDSGAAADEVSRQPIVVATTTNLSALSGSDPTNGRIDRIFMRPLLVAENSSNEDIIDPVTENVTSTATNIDNRWGFETVVAEGTPSGSPALPSIPGGGWIAADEIAQVTVLAGSGTIDVAQIADQRTLFEMATGLVPAATTPDADVVTVDPAVNSQTDVQGSLEDLDTRISANSASGVLVGSFEHVNTTSVKLARDLDQKIVIDIEGTVLTKSDADITFDLTTHLDTGSEASSTWYYCYLSNEGGTLTPHISVTPPELDPASGPVGYKDTVDTDWRFIAAFWNNASSNVEPFDQVGPDFYFRELQLEIDIGTSNPATLTEIDLDDEQPVDSNLVHFTSHLFGDDASVAYSHASKIGTAWTVAAPTPALGMYSIEDPDTGNNRDFQEFSIPLGGGVAARAIGWDRDGGTVVTHKIWIRGWRSRFA